MLSLPVADLKLPLLGGHHQNSQNQKKSDVWNMQHYKSFAQKIQKMNPRATFTKPLMDDAFRAAVSKAPKARLMAKKEVEQMLSRVCKPVLQCNYLR